MLSEIITNNDENNKLLIYLYNVINSEAFELFENTFFFREDMDFGGGANRYSSKK